MIRAKCPGESCSHQFTFESKEEPQTVTCPTCAKIFTFINLGLINCPSCQHAQEISLVTPPSGSISCESCKRRIPFNSSGGQRVPVVKVYTLEAALGFSLYYCGRTSFSGFDDEVTHAKSVLERVAKEKKFLFASRPKKGMYIRVVKSQLKKVAPVKEIQLLHAYCNFPRVTSHENAKYLGPVSGFADGDVFGELVRNHGLVDIWLSNQQLLDKLIVFPALAPYTKRFRVV